MEGDDSLLSPLPLLPRLYHLSYLGESAKDKYVNCMKGERRIERRTGVVRAQMALPLPNLYSSLWRSLGLGAV